MRVDRGSLHKHYSEQSKTILLVELTVPWEEGIEAANERKHAKYTELVEECREAGWKAITRPIEVGCRGFVGSSAVHLVHDIGCMGAECRKARGWQGEIPVIAYPTSQRC